MGDLSVSREVLRGNIVFQQLEGNRGVHKADQKGWVSGGRALPAEGRARAEPKAWEGTGDVPGTCGASGWDAEVAPGQGREDCRGNTFTVKGPLLHVVELGLYPDDNWGPEGHFKWSDMLQPKRGAVEFNAEGAETQTS